jgi:excisionase family DNA binding protein
MRKDRTAYADQADHNRGLHGSQAVAALKQTECFAMKKVFTTGQVAKICKVAPRTVSKWFDSGRLKGYRIPGSQDRRIPREQLIRFLKEHGMPLGELEDEAVGKILIVGAESLIRNGLKDQMNADTFKLDFANSGFEAGIQAESLHPDCVVIDFIMGRNEAVMIAQNLRKNTEYAETVLVGLLSDEDNSSGFDRSVFNETFRKPFDTALLAERIRTLVGRRKQLA